MSSLINNEEGKQIKKPHEIVLFFAIWDEELGPEVLDFCPKTSILGQTTQTTGGMGWPPEVSR